VASRGFPAEQSEAAWLPQADSKPAPGGQEYAAPPRTNAGMLLLDSDPAVREELAGAMSEFGWQVWQADTPERATELLDRHGDRVQVALVDLQLPGLQGVRTLTAISQNHPDLLRCFLSAEVSPYMATAIHRLSSLPLFVKPLRAADLNTSLRKMLLKSPHAEKQSMHV
jgi:DNA-binding NtrC family response regulator